MLNSLLPMNRAQRFGRGVVLAMCGVTAIAAASCMSGLTNDDGTSGQGGFAPQSNGGFPSSNGSGGAGTAQGGQSTPGSGGQQLGMGGQTGSAAGGASFGGATSGGVALTAPMKR